MAASRSRGRAYTDDSLRFLLPTRPSTVPIIDGRELNTTSPLARRRGRAAIALPAPYVEVLDDYAAALRTAPLSEQTQRTYASKVRQFLAWLAGADLDAEPLADANGRDWAVRDYRTHLQAVLKRSPATVNNALVAVDDIYIGRGLGPASAARVEITAAAPRALDQRAQLRYLREVQRCPSPRDQALALVPFYAGARIGEIVALDVDDIARSARKGVLRILGKGQRVRHVPIHPQLPALTGWLGPHRVLQLIAGTDVTCGAGPRARRPSTCAGCPWRRSGA